MLLQAEDGSYIGGALDVILVLKNTETNRYHVGVYLERPFPGGSKPTGMVRLRSHLTHTEGAGTLEELERHLEDLVTKVRVREANVWRKPEQYIEFTGEVPAVMLVRDWTAA